MKESLEVSFRYGAETMWDILDNLELSELGKLDDLVVNFGNGETFDDSSPPEFLLGSWTGTKDTWELVEAACAARNIGCLIRHLVHVD